MENREEYKAGNGELKRCPFCEMDDARYVTVNGITVYQCQWCGAQHYSLDDWNKRPIEDALQQRIAELEAEVEKRGGFVEAFGLLTTLSPSMEIDVNHPLEMAQRIEREVNADRQRIAELEMKLDAAGIIMQTWRKDMVEMQAEIDAMREQTEHLADRGGFEESGA